MDDPETVDGRQLMGADGEDGRLRSLTVQWDERYASPGRTPLDEPNHDFVDWVSR